MSCYTKMHICLLCISFNLPFAVARVHVIDDFSSSRSFHCNIVQGGAFSASVQNERLVLTSPSSNAVWGGGGIWENYVSLRGDFDVQVDYGFISFPIPVTGGWNTVELELVIQGTPHYRLLRDRNSSFDGYAIYGDYGYGWHNMTASSDTSGTLRMCRRGTVLSAYVNNTFFWSDTCTTNDAQVGIVSNRQSTSTPTTVWFDNVSYTADTILGLPGDANCDGKVDVSDLGIIAANYGITDGASRYQADFNGDGKVDVSDLGIIAANYGLGTTVATDFRQDAKAFDLAGNDAGMASAAGRSQKTEDIDISLLQPQTCGMGGLILIASILTTIWCFIGLKIEY